MAKEDLNVGAIEDVVKDAKLVDKGIARLKKFDSNSPTFEPDRRQFLKHAAVLAGLAASGKLASGCATPVQYGGKTYSGWESYLLSQDLIRGPPLLIHSATGIPSDFEHHKQRPVNNGRGAVDYDVPIGTPVVATADAYSKWTTSDRTGGNVLALYHNFGFKSLHLHLSNYAPTISKFSKLQIIAFSGNTGEGPNGYQPPHVHFAIDSPRNPLGIDPFKLGIDQKNPVGGLDQFRLSYGGRPVYWDGKTEVIFGRGTDELLQQSLDTLDSRLKESGLDNKTIDEIKTRKNKPTELRDYLGEKVLMKKPSAPDGKPKYEFMPGSLMYSLMLELHNRTSRHDFTAMLPFIFPPLKPLYQEANPKITLHS